jgi:hypothetical protein
MPARCPCSVAPKPRVKSKVWVYSAISPIFYLSVFNPIASRIAAIKDFSLGTNPSDVGFWFNFDQSELREKRRAVPLPTKVRRRKNGC